MSHLIGAGRLGATRGAIRSAVRTALRGTPARVRGAADRAWRAAFDGRPPGETGGRRVRGTRARTHPGRSGG